MRILRSLLTTWVLVLPPAVALAQPDPPRTPPSIGDIGNPGDRRFVTDLTGVEVEGRLLRVSPDELVLRVGDDERVFRIERIGRIEKRDSLWNGVLIGALPGALMGAAFGSFECEPHCGRNVAAGALVVGAIGAGVGALIDAGAPGYSSLYGPSLGSPNALRVPEPVGSIEDLWRRVRQGDAVELVTIDGRKMRGRLAQVSETAVTLEVSGRRLEIPAADVDRVRRSGNHFRTGALWGATFMAVMGAIASASCGTDSCGNPALVAVYAAMPGALWGTAIGALIPRHAVVYARGASAELHVTPMLGAGRVGLVFSAKF